MLILQCFKKKILHSGISIGIGVNSNGDSGGDVALVALMPIMAIMVGQ